MKKPLIIFGAGGLGREIKTIIDVLPEWEPIGFCDDNVEIGSTLMGLPVLGNREYLLQQKIQQHVVIALGNPCVKSDVVETLRANLFLVFPTIIHPTVILGDKSSIHIGTGSIITAGSIITTAVTIGDYVLVNLNTTIGHDTVVGDYTSVMPGVNIAGKVSIGRKVLIGSGANIINNIRVNDGAKVGSGAVVTKDVQQGTTVVGVPAKIMK